MNKLIKRIYSQAKKYGACDKFAGNENIEQLVKLFLSPQGIEFCQKNNFPDMEIFRHLKQHVEKYGVYIDSGDITLNNPRKIVLIGDTNANITCNTLGRYQVIMLHGAKANISASNWAVLKVTKTEDCKAVVAAEEPAIVL